MDTVAVMETPKILAMVISIGGTPAPIIKSISTYRPEFISFFVSQDTNDQIPAIKAELINMGFRIKSEVTITDDVNDLLHCHEKAEEAVRRAIDKKYKNEEIIIDYTGGTKNMSVALALAAITYGFSFSYVGGGKRTKEGIGVVENGHEKIYHSMNPWDVLAIEEKRKIMALFNQYQFKAAKRLTDTVLEKNSKYRSTFRKMGFLIEGYYRWDIFRYQEAHDMFRRAKIDEWTSSDDKQLKSFAQSTEQLQVSLKKLVEKGKEPSDELIMDLYANSERRFEEGKIDDAILRLYRLVEMVAQGRLLKRFQIDTSNVALDKIQDTLRDGFRKRYTTARSGTIKLPQMAAFQLLKAFDDDVGKIFDKHELNFLDIQSSRNNSYLAHGFSSSNENTYVKLRNFILDLGIVKADDAPRFPKIAG
jgi:CRISPR-associated protein (TIGR02710 family)